MEDKRQMIPVGGLLATAVAALYMVVQLHGQAMRAPHLLERLQVVVVQTELQLEGTIGHAAASLQHGQRVVQHLLEGHALLLSVPWGSSPYML